MSTSKIPTPLVIEWLPPSALHPNPKNARRHSKKQTQQIAESITAFGNLVPIVRDENDVVLLGHGRLAAARLLQLDAVPSLKVLNLSEAQKRALMLADNKIAENAGWNRQMLAGEFGELPDLLAPIGLDLTITGFGLGEIEQVLDDHSASVGDPSDTVPAPQGAAISRPGDVWIAGPHRIACGDARSEGALDRLMAGTKARMVISDPPYNVRIHGHVQGRGRIKHREFAFGSGEMSERQFVGFLKATFQNLVRVTADGAIAFIFIDWRHIGELLKAGLPVFSEYKNLVVWNKTSPAQGTFYRSQHELIGVFKIGAAEHINTFGLGQHGRTRSNVWTYPGVNGFRAGRMDELAMHPTVKPVALIADAMRDCSRKGDIVLDTFLGSGTTVMGAEKVGRRGFGMEVDPAYVDVAVRRWQSYTRDDAVLERTGQTFEEVAAERLSEAAKATKPPTANGATPPGGSASAVQKRANDRQPRQE